MKKYSCLFLLTLIGWEARSQKSFFGVDAGINVANQRVHNVSYPNTGFMPTQYYFSSNGNIFFRNSVKLTFGIFYQLGLSEKFALRLQAKYMGMGYRQFSQNVLPDLDINYLTFPIDLKFYVTRHLCIGAGPYISFTLGGSRIFNKDITSTYHKNDLGFSFGGEHDITKNFALGVNYFVGTKNIWLNDQGGTVKYTNRALQFTLIYKIKKKD